MVVNWLEMSICSFKMTDLSKLISWFQVQKSDQLIRARFLTSKTNLDAQYRGRGIAKEALDLLVNYLETDGRGFKRIVAKVLSKNGASIKFFEKFGFEREGEETVFKEIILFYNLKRSSSTWRRLTPFDPGTIMEEEKFFITERVINIPEFKGIHGILKHRYLK